MRLLYFIFFSIGLPLIFQVTASDNESSLKPQKRRKISSNNTGDSEPQQKRTREVDILLNKSSKRRHSSSDDKNNGASKSKRQVLRKDTPPTSKLPARVESNLTERKPMKKTKIQKRIKSVSLSEENTPKKRDLNDFLELIVPHTPPIQNLFFKYFTNIYSVDHKTKTLILNGDNSSEGFSWEVYVLRVCYSKLSIKTLIFKNLTIGRIIFETIIYFLSCYRNTLEVLIFDHCFFSSNFAIQNYSNLDKLHTAKIVHCALNEEILKNTLSLFPSSLQTLELSHLCKNSFVNKYNHYGPYLTLDFSNLNVNRFSTLKNLYVKRNDIMNFRFENFKNLEEIEVNDKLFKSFVLLKEFYTLIKPIITDCTDLSFGIDLSTLGLKLSEWIDFTDLSYLLNAFYISAEVVTAKFVNELDQILKSIKDKYRDLLELQKSVNGNSNHLNELQSKSSELFNVILKLQILIPKECPKLCDKLEKLKNLKRIKTVEYNIWGSLNYFVEKNIVVDNDTAVIIFYSNLLNVHKKLSTFTHVQFSLEQFTADDISFITSENESTFENLKSVGFANFNNTDKITFMNCILNHFQSIRTVIIELSIENITAEHIVESFEGFKAYNTIENVYFMFDSSNSTVAMCELIVQMLKIVPNLKSLSFKNMREKYNDMLFNRLQANNWTFPKLRKIYIDEYDGQIDLLLWLMQTFGIEELNIGSRTLLCSPNTSLDNFSNMKLRKLCISSQSTAVSILLEKFFSNFVNLKELHFYDLILIELFASNSIIEKVTFENGIDTFKESDVVFAVLKTFKSLKCIYVKFHKNSHSCVISAFKMHFDGRKVKLTFYSEPLYFQ